MIDNLAHKVQGLKRTLQMRAFSSALWPGRDSFVCWKTGTIGRGLRPMTHLCLIVLGVRRHQNMVRPSTESANPSGLIILEKNMVDHATKHIHQIVGYFFWALFAFSFPT